MIIFGYDSLPPHRALSPRAMSDTPQRVRSEQPSPDPPSKEHSNSSPVQHLTQAQLDAVAGCVCCRARIFYVLRDLQHSQDDQDTLISKLQATIVRMGSEIQQLQKFCQELQAVVPVEFNTQERLEQTGKLAPSSNQRANSDATTLPPESDDFSGDDVQSPSRSMDYSS